MRNPGSRPADSLRRARGRAGLLLRCHHVSQLGLSSDCFTRVFAQAISQPGDDEHGEDADGERCVRNQQRETLAPDQTDSSFATSCVIASSSRAAPMSAPSNRSVRLICDWPSSVLLCRTRESRSCQACETFRSDWKRSLIASDLRQQGRELLVRARLARFGYFVGRDLGRVTVDQVGPDRRCGQRETHVYFGKPGTSGPGGVAQLVSNAGYLPGHGGRHNGEHGQGSDDEYDRPGATLGEFGDLLAHNGFPIVRLFAVSRHAMRYTQLEGRVRPNGPDRSK